MKALEKYVGRYVRLNKKTFEELPRRRGQKEVEFENHFLVATISREMCKLVCYGANTRVAVGVGDVVLI